VSHSVRANCGIHEPDFVLLDMSLCLSPNPPTPFEKKILPSTTVDDEVKKKFFWKGENWANGCLNQQC